MFDLSHRQTCVPTRLAMLVSLMALGCREKEVVHEGKPIAYWVQQMTSPDSGIRHQAVRRGGACAARCLGE